MLGIYILGHRSKTAYTEMHYLLLSGGPNKLFLDNYFSTSTCLKNTRSSPLTLGTLGLSELKQQRRIRSPPPFQPAPALAPCPSSPLHPVLNAKLMCPSILVRFVSTRVNVMKCRTQSETCMIRSAQQDATSGNSLEDSQHAFKHASQYAVNHVDSFEVGGRRQAPGCAACSRPAVDRCSRRR